MSEGRTDPAGAVTALVRRGLADHRGPGPLVLGIDGRSGAGKSGLTAAVRARLVEHGLPPGDVVVLALEDAYPGWAGLAAGVAEVAHHVLAPLTAGRVGRYRSYDWQAGRAGPVRRVPPAGAALPRVLLVEGCGAGARACAPYLDLLVWLEAPEAERRRRALARDDGTWAHRWEMWAAQERALLAARDARAAADLVLVTG